MSSRILLIAMLAAMHGGISAQEARLGRLFYTPEERQKLDQKRGVVERESGPQNVMINGMVVRSGQAPILFIDGKESRGPADGKGPAQQMTQGVPLKTESGKQIAAKPGQIVDLSSGRTIETYQLVPGIVPDQPSNVDLSGASGRAGISSGKQR